MPQKSHTRCEFCEIALRSDLDVSRHLASETHRDNVTKATSLHPLEKDTARHVAKNIASVFETLKLRSSSDVKDLADKDYFRLPTDKPQLFQVSNQLAEVLLKSVCEYSTKADDETRKLILESFAQKWAEEKSAQQERSKFAQQQQQQQQQSGDKLAKQKQIADEQKKQVLKKAEEDRKRKAEEERLKKVEAERLKKVEEERLKKFEEERLRKAEVERLKQAEDERSRKAEADRLRKEQLEVRRKEKQLEQDRLDKQERKRQRLEAQQQLARANPSTPVVPNTITRPNQPTTRAPRPNLVRQQQPSPIPQQSQIGQQPSTVIRPPQPRQQAPLIRAQAQVPSPATQQALPRPPQPRLTQPQVRPQQAPSATRHAQPNAAQSQQSQQPTPQLNPPIPNLTQMPRPLYQDEPPRPRPDSTYRPRLQIIKVEPKDN